MHIENINITFAPAHSPLAAAFLKAFTEAPNADSADARTETKPPAIGEIWAEQGGIYAGLTRGRDGEPDAHLILHVAEAPEEQSWDAALKWAEGVEADGHKDFHVPTRFESALLYANLQELFSTDDWYWTSTQYAGNAGCAWDQYFDNGSQDLGNKSYERRVRAVRRFEA